jgi:hypothetical protein
MTAMADQPSQLHRLETSIEALAGLVGQQTNRLDQIVRAFEFTDRRLGDLVDRITSIDYHVASLDTRIGVQNGRIGKVENEIDNLRARAVYSDGMLAVPKMVTKIVTNQRVVVAILILLTGVMAGTDGDKILTAIAAFFGSDR